MHSEPNITTCPVLVLSGRERERVQTGTAKKVLVKKVRVRKVLIKKILVRRVLVKKVHVKMCLISMVFVKKVSGGLHEGLFYTCLF